MKIQAFFTALLLLAVVILAVYLYTDKKLSGRSPVYGGWTSEVKYKAGSLMAEQMDRNTLLVMGSSELQHQKSTPYHPNQIFAGQQTNLMLVGAGYYQSLFHATLVAALEPKMQNRKAVLIVAPQWFRKSGVKPEAYASRFSEENFVEMLKNPDLPDEIKKYIMKRTKKLLKVDPKTLGRVRQYERQYLGDGTEADFSTRMFQTFMKEKTRSNVALRLTAYELFGKEAGGTRGAVSAAVPIPLGASNGNMCAASRYAQENGLAAGLMVPPPDFESLREAAAKDGEAGCGGNPFYVKKSYYDSYIVKVMDDVKDDGIKTGYSVSPEFDDLDCFLQVCKSLEIKPLVVITPVNGYWYDWIGFDADAREDYYSQVRALAEKYGAETADFSDREYEKYFMEDTIHIGWKGWVDACEEIYRFSEE